MRSLFLSLILILAPIASLCAQEWDDDFMSDQELDELEDYQEFPDEIREGVNERVKMFDIAGIMLNMEMDSVREAMRERMYTLKNTEFSIPEFFQFNYDALCRARNIFLPEAVRNCIEAFGKSEKVRYMAHLTYERPDTKETIDVFFTSPLTKNRVWKIDYKNDVDDKPGPGINFQYQREERRRAFWFSVTQKYGAPNVGNNRWVLDTSEEFSQNLRAFFGRLILENQQQNLADVFETQREARRTFKTKDFTF